MLRIEIPNHQDTTKNISMVRKKKIAAIDDEYRSVLLDAGVKML